jgi:integrase
LVEEHGGLSDADKEAIIELLDAFDPKRNAVAPPDGMSTKANATLANYAKSLTGWARAGDGDLLETTTDGFNRIADDMFAGITEVGPDDGYSQNSVRFHQNCLKRALRYFGDRAEADADEIARMDNRSSKVDPADMLDRDEMQAMRDAALNDRDKALFDFLLFTGQRKYAALTLRWKDLDLENGRFRLNTDTTNGQGLKGADDVAKWRPLLGAAGSLRRWKHTHPDSDDGDAFVFTASPTHPEYDPHSSMSQNGPNRILSKLADRAGVDKPTNPHAMKHNFATMAYLVYDVDTQDIKTQLGHVPGSDVFETTYAHLSDKDTAERIEDAFGVESGEEEEKSLTPARCGKCGEGQPPGAKACRNCGEVFTLDANAVENQMEETTYQKKASTEPGSEADKGIDLIREAIKSDPELKREVVEDPEVREALLDDLAADVADRISGD